MGQWGSRLSAGPRLLEVLEAGHCGEIPDANVEHLLVSSTVPRCYVQNRFWIWGPSKVGRGEQSQPNKSVQLKKEKACIKYVLSAPCLGIPASFLRLVAFCLLLLC